MSKQSMRQPFSRNTLVMGPGKNKGSKVKYPTELDTPVNLRTVRPSLLHTSTLPMRFRTSQASHGAEADRDAHATNHQCVYDGSSMHDRSPRMSHHAPPLDSPCLRRLQR